MSTLQTLNSRRSNHSTMVKQHHLQIFYYTYSKAHIDPASRNVWYEITNKPTETSNLDSNVITWHVNFFSNSISSFLKMYPKFEASRAISRLAGDRSLVLVQFYFLSDPTILQILSRSKTYSMSFIPRLVLVFPIKLCFPSDYFYPKYYRSNSLHAT